jgi:diguanylate cyclase (GGDEF)-like protein
VCRRASKMTTTEPNAPLTGPEIESRLRNLDRRSAGLWVTASVLMLLLTAAVYAAALPQIERHDAGSDILLVALRSLVGLVLLFNAFAVYQQVTLRRFRKGLSVELRRIQMVDSRNELLEKLSTVDKLTELYNRRYMDERLPLECERADRGQYALTLVLIDLNHFKETNDEHGHAAGDAVLQAFSAKLRRSIRAIDVPIRLGGDEFLVCLPECTAEQVPPIARRMRGGIAHFDGKDFPIDFAIGWAQRASGEPADAVLARADEAMYRNKAECHRRDATVITS